ncbi:MAG TPA: aldehyde reductase [Bacteroidales bacterium]|nr:aldehyde reductase [Bacteroidales bacterium]HRZ75844.1 aldehyde reductase [Bacteroidales bacterium]
MNTFLVTGASGYIASWIVRYLLEEGHEVHGTVRDPGRKEKVGHLLEMKAAYPGNLSLFKADLLDKESFREAMTGCDIVIHTASPFIINKIKDPYSQLVQPAVQGTTHVLGLVNEFPGITRVVLTSSVAAIHGDAADVELTGDGSFTEEHWNTSSSLKYNPYQYSKRLAEEAAWEIARAQDHWNLVVINPGLVLGPPLSGASDSASLGIMNDLVGGKYRMGVPDLYFGIVDVRDVARAHIAAALQPAAQGRHICVGDVVPLLEVANLLREDFPSLPLPRKVLPRWLVSAAGPFMGISARFVRRNLGIPYRLDHSKSMQSLGMSYLPMRTTLKDHVVAMKR